MEGPFQAKVTYSYEYDDTNGKGSLYHEGKKIADICVFPVKNDFQLENDLVRHVNFLKCLFVDRVRRNLICECPVESVEEYLGRWLTDKGRRYRIMKYYIPCPNRLVEKKTSLYLPPVFRAVIRQLYTFVIDQHIRGESLTDFNLNDMWMDVKISSRGKEFVEADKITGLRVSGVGFIKPATEITRKHDFDQILVIIGNMIGLNLVDSRSLQSCPHALVDLVTKTKNFNFQLGAIEEKVLANHLAIMPPSETLKFIKECSEQLYDIDRRNPDPEHQSKVDSNILVLSRVKALYNWESKFADEGYRYIQHCYNYQPQGPNQRIATYHQTGDSCLVKHSMLGFARNMTEHLRKTCRLQVDDLELETIIMELFHDQLLTTHSSLHKSKRLHEVMKMV